MSGIIFQIIAVHGDITFLYYPCDKVFEGNQCLKTQIIAVHGGICY